MSERRKAQINGDPATLFLRVAVGIHAGQRRYQRGFAMVDVTNHANDGVTHRAVPKERNEMASRSRIGFRTPPHSVWRINHGIARTNPHAFLQSRRDLTVDQASLAESDVPGGLLTAVNEWLHYSY